MGLVSAAALHADTRYHVFDCRFNLTNPSAGADAYALGHIPGARYVHLGHDLSRPVSHAPQGHRGPGGRHPLPDPEVFALRLGQWGLTPDSHVALYDDAGGMFAARMWWMLRWIGHRGPVDVLDGGLPAWRAAGLPLTDALPHDVRCDYPFTQAGPVVLAEDVMTHLRGEGQAMFLLDARSPDRFRGENETLDPVGGHIPGARNRFFRLNLNDDGYFKSPAQLRAEFLAQFGDVSPTQVVHSCGSGVTACHNLLAMEIAGLPGANLYAGSWSEWCSDSSRPVATGD